eukprot:gb/GECG01005574.1/.p1 GENE.gb/GECG01005574.1/~~gb/GECG01005574.1/.p1  ORF type:complete len:213 (+),score=31.15 gb/GECG01005574.1/:1-639(+)
MASSTSPSSDSKHPNSSHYAVFIRALNVSSANRITMPALRKHIEDAGLEWISSYLATGNLVLGTRMASVDEVTETINSALRAAGLNTAEAIVWQSQDLIQLIEKDHFTEKYPESEWRHCVAFFAQPPPDLEAGRKYLTEEKDVVVLEAGDRFVIFAAPREKKGFSVNIERAFRITGTTRWWNVLHKFVQSRVIASSEELAKKSSKKTKSSRT